LEIANSKQQRKLRHIFVHSGIEVQTGIAKTGVVGILKGGKPGPGSTKGRHRCATSKERVDIPLFLNQKVNTIKKVSIMHACGHDTHIAMLMGTAEVLASIKKTQKEL
jgi:metal-dependent amidase/aminoacylase/carboxypeptidase family protein